MNDQSNVHRTPVRVVVEIPGLPDLVFEKELTDKQLDGFTENLSVAFVSAVEDDNG